uniref:efflux RND transporter permease subunit n=1 Tax=Klebsiella pneumoniae TaxID=573 RepID=UPI00210CBCBF
SEGDFALQALRVPGTSLSQSVDMQQRLEKAIAEQVPEVKRTFARTGTAEIAADPMTPNISDSYVMLKPKEEWPDPDKSREQLIEDIQKAAASV